MDDEETFQIRAEVFALIPEYGQAILRAGGGRKLAITQHTEGVSLTDLSDGQLYLLTVKRRFCRVSRAQLVAPDQILVEVSKPN